MLDKILPIVGVIVGSVRLIKEFIELVEVPGHGEEKKQAALELISASYDHINSVITLPQFPKTKFLLYLIISLIF